MSDLNEQQQTSADVNTESSVEQQQVYTAVQEQPSENGSSETMMGTLPETSFGPEIASGAETKKKKHVGIIAAVAAVVVLAGGSAAAYNLVPSVKNAVKMAVLDDTEYYQWVETENMKKLSDSISEGYDSVLDNDYAEEELKLDLKLEADAVTALLESASGASLSESGITLPETISVEAAEKRDDMETVKSAAGVKVDGKQLITLNAYLQDGSLYYQIPELSSDYVAMNPEQLMTELAQNMDSSASSMLEMVNGSSNGEESLEDLISSDDITTLLTTYSDDIFSNIENVELEKKVEESANGVSQKYTVLTANIDEGTLFSILSDALKDAENDKIIRDLAVKLGICTEEEYSSAISELKDKFNTYEIKGGKDVAVMKVYVDNKGQICGRSFDVVYETVDDKIQLSYLCAQDGRDTGITAALTVNDASFDITGSFENVSDKVSGAVDVALNSGDESYSFAVDLKDIETVGKKNQYLNGSVSLDLSSLSLGVLTFDLSSDGNSQDVSTDIVVDGTKYASLLVSSSEKISMDIPEFDSSAKVHNFTTDGTGLQEYISNADLETFLNNIGSAFGIDGFGSLMGINSAYDDGMGGSGFSVIEDSGYTVEVPDETEASSSQNGSEETSYDLSKVKLQLNGTDITLPAKINGIGDYVKFEDTTVEPNGFAFGSSDDYTISVSVENTGAAAAAPSDCTISSISVYEGSPLNLSFDGFELGSTASEAAAKYGITLSDPDSGYVTISDTTNTWNSISFYYTKGVIYSISVYFYEF